MKLNRSTNTFYKDLSDKMNNEIIADFMCSAVAGVSKAQLTRNFKERYGYSDEEIAQIIRLCSFKAKPQKIDYKSFAELPITAKANQIKFPFTQIYTFDNFLSAEECAKLRDIIDSRLRPSTVADSEDACIVSDYRTSKTADMPYLYNDFYAEIDKKITKCMGCDHFLGEIMQAQKYEVGQYYKEHWDFFKPKTREFKVYCDWMGQRTWTAMVYLNDVDEGGETLFKFLKLKLKPKEGTIVAWNNLYKNGLPNFKTLHEALPPISGDKYVITKWYWSWSLF